MREMVGRRKIRGKDGGGGKFFLRYISLAGKGKPTPRSELGPTKNVLEYIDLRIAQTGQDRSFQRPRRYSTAFL